MTTKMICPICNVEMNHHGDKLVSELQASPYEEGTIKEFHSCPSCGRAASRPE